MNVANRSGIRLLVVLAVLLPGLRAQEEAARESLSIEEVEASLEESLASVESEPSGSVTANLIRLLVKKGTLSESEAVGLIRQAEEEAALVEAQTKAVEEAAAQVRAAAEEEARLAGEEAVRVTYVPEYVRDAIAADVRAEVLEETRREDFLSRDDLPSWLERVSFFGDVRLRGEFIRYPIGNDNSGSFPDFNAINTGDPFDVTGFVFSPQWNTDEDRSRYRLRARLGLEADLADGFFAGLRLATGSGSSPVTTNQTAGDPGNFSKYSIWLDRAFLRWEVGQDPDRMLAIVGGRFDNPFFSSSLVWDDDLGFDGVAVEGRYRIADGVVPFASAGIFPVFNTSLNYPTNSPSKFESDDRYLTALQGGLEVRPHRYVELRGAVGYYDFDKIEGELSDPFVPLTDEDPGSTDTRRPPFAQKGNTYMALRDIVPVPANNFGTTMQWQYFGLATPFRVMTITGEMDLNFFEPVQITLFGEYGHNMALDSGAINGIAVNNRGANPAAGGFGDYAGGADGWLAGLRVGHPKFDERWNWRFETNYRYIESDAFVDAFVDSDFGLGGTNVKGWTLKGNVALAESIWFGVTWMSSTQVAGPPFKVDVLQLDISAKY